LQRCCHFTSPLCLILRRRQIACQILSGSEKLWRLLYQQEFRASSPLKKQISVAKWREPPGFAREFALRPDGLRRSATFFNGLPAVTAIERGTELP
jgi:hypothetical protein